MGKGVLGKSTLLLVFTGAQAGGGVKEIKVKCRTLFDFAKKQRQVDFLRNSYPVAKETTVSYLIKVRHLGVDDPKE
jgi:hypothetical protein